MNRKEYLKNYMKIYNKKYYNNNRNKIIDQVTKYYKNNKDGVNKYKNQNTYIIQHNRYMLWKEKKPV